MSKKYIGVLLAGLVLVGGAVNWQYSSISSAQAAADDVVRGPYLQMPTSTAITIKWRTAGATNSRVSVGLAANALTTVVDDSATTTEHEVRVTGLKAATRYFYSVGSTQGVAASGNDYYFVTSPAPGVQQSTRIWVLGDSGTANQDAAAVRDAYTKYAGSRAADVWLMLGDNAYGEGTDSQYQKAVFDMYPKYLRNLPLWSTLGNHETYGGKPYAYWSIFNLPTQAEVGGVPSGTEAYYSFDYGDIHFVCLDSMDAKRVGASPTQPAPMVAWLQQDLAQSDKSWNVVFFHHPPYSKGTHDSDGASETVLREMREAVVPVLEEYGVDLVLSGHSHNYERSYFLDGHYGASQTFNADTMTIDRGDGREDGDGVYKKLLNSGRSGVVYSVAGSSGQAKDPTGPKHPAMYIYLKQLGSMVIDVNGDRLDAAFVDAGGNSADHFTLLKTNTLVATGSTWKYWDKGTVPSDGWAKADYEDGAWKTGSARLGYGDGLEKTSVSFGGEASNRYVTTYFRHAFTVADTASVKKLSLRLLKDDGAVVYINGQEAYRSNMPTGAVTNDTLAKTTIEGASESQFEQVSLPATFLVTGNNVLAVEVHQSARNSSDVAFDAGLMPTEPTLQKTFKQLYVRGTFNQWGRQAMALVDDHIWKAEVTFTSAGGVNDKFKFDVFGDWKQNYGDKNADGLAELGTQNDDIIAPGAGVYVVTFNDQTLRYTVDKKRTPPVANAGSDIVIDAGGTVTFDAGASSDADGQIVSYSWSNGLSGVKPSAQFKIPGDYEIALTVSDNDGMTATDSVKVTVRVLANKAPVADAGSDISIDAGLNVALNGKGADSDGTIIGYRWEQLTGPAVALNANNVANPQFVAPGVAVQTVLSFRLTVTDNQNANGSDEVSVTVKPKIIIKPNQSPTANAGVDQSIQERTLVIVDGSGTDPDGDLLTYSWSQESGPIVTLTGVTQPSLTFTAPVVTAEQTVVLRLTVTDSHGAAASDTVSITIQPRPASSGGGDSTTDTGSKKDSGGAMDVLLACLLLGWFAVQMRRKLSGGL